MPAPLILAGRTSAWRYAELRDPGGIIAPLPERWARERAGETITVAGFYGRLGGHDAAVFAHAGALLVKVGYEVVALDPSVSVELRRGRVLRSLMIRPPAGRPIGMRYLRPVRSFVAYDDGFDADGDRDFGALIAEIAARASDPEDPLLRLWPFQRRLGAS